uniref:Transcription factor E4F1-like n=1 Tax=Saccoglossus kowalevskii TaxID=10224 RepID=A0ABM0MQD2_SACKO|nr:PREDICTED: transcription factor E4F1-like [Saccoglossus kowalevskii]
MQVAMNSTDVRPSDSDGNLQVDDVHRCAQCQIEFYTLSEYVAHKYYTHRLRITFTTCKENPQIVLPSLQPIEKENINKDAYVYVAIDDSAVDNQQSSDNNSGEQQLGLKCADCERTFRHEEALDKHRRVNHQIYSCEKCNITLKSISAVKAHVKSHSPSGKPFVCGTCNKSFKLEAILKAHLKVHSGIRDYKCPECGDSFKTKGSLDRHLRRHTDERPFVCPDCGRSFRESGALTRHIKAPTACPLKGKSPEPEDDTTCSSYNSSAKIPSITHNIGTRLQTKVKQVQEQLSATALQQQQQQQQQQQHESIAEENVIQAAENAENSSQVLYTENEPKQHIEIIDTREAEVFLPLQCRACREVFDNTDSLREHLKMHIGTTPHRCGLCIFATRTRNGLQDHMMSAHSKRLIIINEVDEVMEETEQATVQVVENMETDNDAQIDMDKEEEENGSFSAAVQQFIELQDTGDPVEPINSGIHGYRVTHKCYLCHRSFRGKSYLRAHLRKHTGEKPFECTYCPKRFRCKDFLNKHLLIHTNERRYKCGECGKLYKRITHVKEHLRIHSNERPYVCEHCSKGFKTKNILQTHLRTHTNDAPWKCQYCTKSFKEKASVVRHERSHTGERPFKCERCGKGFAEHGTLRRHERSKVPCKPSAEPAEVFAGPEPRVSNKEESDLRNSENIISSKDDCGSVSVVLASKDYDSREDSTVAASVLAEFSSVVANTQEYIINIVETSGDGTVPNVRSTDEEVVQTVLLTESMLADEQSQLQPEQQQQTQHHQEIMQHSQQVTEQECCEMEQETMQSVTGFGLSEEQASNEIVQQVAMTTGTEDSFVAMKDCSEVIVRSAQPHEDQPELETVVVEM